MNLLLLSLSLVVVSCMSKPIVNKMDQTLRGFDAELSTYQYPFEVKFYALSSQSQNLKMAFMDVPAEKPTDKVIVLLHGKNFPGAYFEQVIQHLSQNGYRVIVPDQIGFGKSTKPQNYQYSFHTLALNTHALLRSLGVTKFHLLGHSMGGMLATRLSLMYPESVSKLILVNPIGLEDWKTMTSYRSVDENFKAELNNTVEKTKKYQLDNYYDGQWRSDYDKWLMIPNGWIAGPDHRLIAWNAALTSDMIFTQPVLYEFKKIKVDTLLIIGQRDRTAIGKSWAPPQIKEKMGDYPSLGNSATKAIPKAKLIKLEGLGHMPFVEDIEIFWKALSKNLD